MLRAHSRFRTKFNLVAGVGVIIGLAASVLAGLTGVRSLEREAIDAVEGGLNEVTREYLHTHIVDSAVRTSMLFRRSASGLQILSAITQGIVDEGALFDPVHEVLGAQSGIEDKLRYVPPNDIGGHRYENGSDEPMALAVWGYLLDPPTAPGQPPAIRPDVLQTIHRTAIYDLIFPLFQQKGSSNLQVYFVGPESAPFLRIAPWSPAAARADEKYPGHNEKPFWSFYFPTLVDSWRTWISAEGGPDARADQVTVLPPYEDAGGGGLVTTFLHPIWSPDRRAFAGAVGIDLTLNQIVEYIEDQKLYDSGFAFLAQSNGNVLAINQEGAELLGLGAAASAGGGGGGGVDVLNRTLGSSKHDAVARLQKKLPQDGKSTDHKIVIGSESYKVVLQRIEPFETWTGKPPTADGGGIRPEHWTLGLVVPTAEIYRSRDAARATIEKSTTTIITSQSVIALLTLLSVLLGISVLSRRMTVALEELSQAARALMGKDYGVTVRVHTDDEIGELATAFNAMAAEIRAYTMNLEELVRQRTAALERANYEISLLNERLKEENLRMGAELAVARRLQLMVLPDEAELERVEGLDIAGYMEPADEVGGDYYDVLQGSAGVKIGIGDVTGHGLESGVLMIMLQAAVRTLVLAEETDPERFMSIINKAVYQNIQRTSIDRSLTLNLIDYHDGVLQLVGQHEEAIVVRVDGGLELIDTMPLGLPVGLDFEIDDFLGRLEIPLAPGDAVLLYTDGITEAENPDGEQYGIERLCAAARAHHRKSAAELKDAVIADVEQFINFQKVFDDITLVVIKREGEGAE